MENIKEFTDKKNYLREKIAFVNPGSLLGFGWPPNEPIGTALQLGAGVVQDTSKPTTESLGYNIQRALFPLTTRIKAEDIAAKSFIESASKSMGDKATSLLADMAAKVVGNMENQQHSKTRKLILEVLKKEDPIIAQATDKNLNEAYHTMAKYAPTLSTDKNAVKSFLRGAVQHEGGLDYNAIKGLAAAENEVNKKVMVH